MGSSSPPVGPSPASSDAPASALLAAEASPDCPHSSDPELANRWINPSSALASVSSSGAAALPECPVVASVSGVRVVPLMPPSIPAVSLSKGSCPRCRERDSNARNR
jgi:hypothetical protein